MDTAGFRPDGAAEKVFGIGLNKTGTTSLQLALRRLGYRTTGSNKTLLKSVRRGVSGPAIAHAHAFDAFSDWPWPLIYRQLFEEFGSQAHYILTRRSSFEKWFASIENHARSSRLFRGQFLAYGYYRPFGRAGAYREIYETHNRQVRDFFTSGPGAGAPFLEICLDEGDGWAELCQFLKCDTPQEAFPHKNTAANRKQKWRGRGVMNSFIEPAYKAYVRLAGS